MNRIKPCPAMKDSGVEWLGNVLTNREVRGLKSSTANDVYQTNYAPMRALDEIRAGIFALERESEGLLEEIVRVDKK